ncbi:MAG: DNA polymerase I [Lachnospiraceae bacterium]|nr:DNA polymerase I [Lachnospiraceae bacterium]
MGDYLLLIDGSSLLTTNFFGNLPREILFAKDPSEKEKYYHKIMMTSKGVYTNAVFGFLRTLFKILKDQKPAYLAVAWDLTRDTFRREKYPDYKANRTETMQPLSDQFELCQKVLKRMGVAQFMSETYEADDWCGSLAKKFEQDVPVKIFTKDHDYLQLVNENTHMWLMHTSAEKTEEMYKKYRLPHDLSVPDRAFELDPKLVEEEFGVAAEHINSLKGLQGDPSDNIKGVPGVGPQTAIRLIREYGTVNALYEAIHAAEKTPNGLDALKKDWKERLGIARSPISFLLKESDTELVGEASARLSEELATMYRDIDLSDTQLEDLKIALDRDAVTKVLDELEIQSLNTDFLSETGTSHDITEQFSATNDLTTAETWIRDLVKAKKPVGVYYEKGIGLAVAKEDGSTILMQEMFFITQETLKKALLTLYQAIPGIYSIHAKNIVKLADLALPDVSLMAYLIDPLKSDPQAEEIAKNHLHLYQTVTPEFLPQYRAYVALKAYPVLRQQLEDLNMLALFNDLETPVMGCLSRMEDEGIRTDREALKNFAASLKVRINALEEEIHTIAGEKFNINSPKQLGEILFVKLGLPTYQKKKTGFSTAADILEKLAADYPIVSKVLEYRTYSKLYSTYAEGLQNYIAEDGRIHCNFNQTITATGRISSTNPNLQNIPARTELGRQIRRVFVPKEGCVFIDADYSQIELRVLAHFSQDANLIEAYNSAEDIHTLTASQVFHVPMDEVTPAMRRDAKVVNFGIIYGMSAFSLADDLSITNREAKQYMDNYFASYPGIKAYLDGQVAFAKENGYVTTLLNRMRPIPELSSANFNQRAFGERVAMNSPIQGSAADIMKLAMIRVEKALKDAGLQTKIVLQIHDELVLEAPVEEKERAEEILVFEMQNVIKLSVPLIAEAKCGYSLYETK